MKNVGVVDSMLLSSSRNCRVPRTCVKRSVENGMRSENFLDSQGSLHHHSFLSVHRIFHPIIGTALLLALSMSPSVTAGGLRASSSSSSSRSLSSRSTLRLYQRSSRSGACRNKALLSMLFDQGQMACGNPGWTFPGLIWGDCPITACMLRMQQPAFGGPWDF